ncbi:hypothetical protein Riv7116_0221 [Rivularia sp. PCC 7116]|uniref:hypothetical protein n=1 Tax=Rivularia sp. PCC 7116 TaxID=373994 RepID=UPI00029F2552|nr:hypothetical protein [Rivularia sp. PCC 7116]AFY52828.1 hypothetical protein Riv7116_0221 [Rivularia sp. PCC 7116]
MKILPLIAIFTTINIATPATAQLIPPTPVKINNPSIPDVRVIRNGTTIRIYNGKIIKNIRAKSLKVRVLDSQTCQGKQVQRQTLSGKRFLTQTIEVDKQTGNLAVGVLLQDCFKQKISAAFILQPEPNWNNYIIHRVPIPGARKINNRFSTYPLRNIKGLGFVDGNLIIKYANSDNSEAMLVYTSSNKPIGKYAGCVVTKQSKNNNICPHFN